MTQETISLSIHLFVKEVRKYKCPLAKMQVNLLDDDIEIRLVGIDLNGKKPDIFQGIRKIPFCEITEWPTTKIVDQAYYMVLDMFHECLEFILKESRKNSK